MRKGIILGLFLTFFGMVQSAEAAEYALDKSHTTISFKIRHLFSWTQGQFNEFDGSFVYDLENPDAWTVDATIQAASIDTNQDARDKHLKSKDFFDVENHPTMTFKSTKVTDVAPDSAKLHGLLNLHGVEKEVVLDLEILGVGKDPWGNELAGFSASTTIDRKDFGLNWNETLETGGVLVGDKVKISIEVEGIKQ